MFFVGFHWGCSFGRKNIMSDFDDLLFLLFILSQTCLFLIMWFMRIKNWKFRGLKGQFIGLVVA
jgi:hypothetical protein